MRYLVSANEFVDELNDIVEVVGYDTEASTLRAAIYAAKSIARKLQEELGIAHPYVQVFDTGRRGFESAIAVCVVEVGPNQAQPMVHKL